MTGNKPTHIVVHKGFYRRVNGVLQALKEGTELTLDKQQAEHLVKRGFVKAIGAVEETEKDKKVSKKAAV